MSDTAFILAATTITIAIITVLIWSLIHHRREHKTRQAIVRALQKRHERWAAEADAAIRERRPGDQHLS